MKIPLWCLVVLLACLFSPGCSDCQGECVACGLLLQRQQLQQAFNTMVCLLECEGHVASALTWEACERAVQLSRYRPDAGGAAPLKRAGGEPELTSLDLNSAGELLRSAAAAEGQEEEEEEAQRGVQYDSSLLESSEEREEEAEEGEEEDFEERQPREERNAEGDAALSKRFGGFQRGRHGYRKLVGSPVRPLQKRYGGFIGVRKSARKWNSQKRVNQLLRQYLGMRSSRSGRLNGGPVTRVWRQNKL